MPEPETQFGPYRIERPLGRGAMGEVYLARDTRLNRTVAVKRVTPEFRGRFDREAKAIAALNHPNVCQLYDVGPDYLVMEFVDGEPIAAVDSLRKLLDFAVQIADGLSAAHAAGIIHRDLKPANILVTGPHSERPHQIKILDFGIATYDGGSTANADQDLTIAGTRTEARTIVGTIAYMSPEQALGIVRLTPQSDQFSFGLMLWELVMGRHPFARDTPAETMAAIIREDTPALPPHIPAQLRWIIERLVAKDPADRYESTRDLYRDLRQLRDRLPEISSQTLPGALPAPRRDRRLLGIAVAAGVVLGAVAAAALLLWLRRAPAPLRGDRPSLRFALAVDAANSPQTNFAISPDGLRVAFQMSNATETQLAVQSLADASPVMLPGTENAANPFFSPDGAWLGFVAAGRIMKVPLAGGAPVVIDSGSVIAGATWGERGAIVASIAGPAEIATQVPLAVINANGGTAQPLVPFESHETTHRWPQFLPGGEHVLYTAHNLLDMFDDANVRVVSVKTGKVKTVVKGGYFGRYLPSGHLLYVRGGVLYGIRFDPATLETRGDPVALLRDLAVSTAWGSAQFDFSQTGAFFYRRQTVASWPYVWMDSSGKTEPLLPPGNYYTPRLSPDGSALAFVSGAITDGNVSVYEWQRQKLTPLTADGQGHFSPAWAPDGKHAVYRTHSAAGPFSFDWVRADGGGEPQRLLTSDRPIMPGGISRSGILVYAQGDTAYDIWTLPLDLSDPERPKPGTPAPYLQTRANELQPVFSPDGRWLAYVSNADRGRSVYVRPFPIPADAPDRRWMVSSGGGDFPVWSSDGQLFYSSAGTTAASSQQGATARPPSALQRDLHVVP
jgi:Tol biopolymer transport system component/predicted Ser/Thr protein kinase